MLNENEKAKEIVEALIEDADYSPIFFTSPSYYNAIVGVSHDGRIIYDYDKMVDYLIENDGIDYENAVDWIDYNVFGVLNQENAPIIMYGVR